MKEVRVNYFAPGYVTTMVDLLLADGLTPGTDFDFAYFPGEHYAAKKWASYVIFKFYDEKSATWYGLKWK
jgi:hypothetical protein